jgi:putative sterol carrier protein
VTGRIKQARQGAAGFLRSMEIVPGVFTNSSYNKPVHTPGMRLPATYNAVSCLKLLGIEIGDHRGLESFLNGFQVESGVYRIPEMKAKDLYYPDFEYDDFHITNYVLSAIERAGKPAKPFAFLSDYDTPERLGAWLAKRDMTRPWTEGNYIVNLASFFEYTGRNDLLEIMYEWHIDNQDEYGYWHDPSTNDLTSAMAGAAHNLHIFYRLNRPVPRYRRIIDHCLSLPDEASTACIDVDIADILAHFTVYGYRTGEIKKYLEKKLINILDIQQGDGGFYDTTSGIRLFDGWSVYREPQGLSNCFATWFRMATIGFCAEILYPGEFVWCFRKGIGIGYRNPAYLRGGFSEPTERPARQYSRTDQAETQDTAGCSKALLSVVDDIGRRFGGARLGFVCVFEISGEGVFTLDLRDGTARPGGEPTADLRLGLNFKTLTGILQGRMSPTAAYALRKLKMKGDMSKALKMAELLGRQ